MGGGPPACELLRMGIDEMISRYKKDQGRMVRMGAFWGITLLLLYGCMFLHENLSGRLESMSVSLFEAFPVIPIVAVTVNGAFLISTAVFVVGVLLIHRWQQGPKVADLLIETEAELGKVSWPTLKEVVDSSLVVIVCVVFLMGYLAGTDIVLGRIFRRILFLGG